MPQGESHGEVEADENEARVRLHNRSQSADLEKAVRFKHNSNENDIQSEIDEDRVILDPEQFFEEADLNDRKVEGSNNKDFRTEETPIKGEGDAEMKEKEKQIHQAISGNHKPQHDEKPENFESTKTGYISSYSKFQKIHNQKDAQVHEHSHQGNDLVLFAPNIFSFSDHENRKISYFILALFAPDILRFSVP